MSTPRLSLARLPRALAFGAGAGLCTALPLSRVPRTTTAVTAGATVAALVAAGAAMGPVDPKTGEPGTGAPVSGERGTGEPAACESAPQQGRLARLTGGVAIGSAVGVVVGGSLWVNLRVDAALEDLLRRRGVARPRLALALGVGVLTGLLEWADAVDDADADAGEAGRAADDAGEAGRAADDAGEAGRAAEPAVPWTP